jgi:hypothetical protein
VDYIALARKAMSHLDEPRGEMASQSEYEDYYRPFFDSLDENVYFRCPCPPDTPIYGGEILGKQALIDAFTKGDPDLITNIRMERPLEFIADGSRVVVLGAESYDIKRNGRTSYNRDFAMVLDFNAAGLIERYIHIEDQSDFYVGTKE